MIARSATEAPTEYTAAADGCALCFAATCAPAPSNGRSPSEIRAIKIRFAVASHASFILLNTFSIRSSSLIISVFQEYHYEYRTVQVSRFPYATCKYGTVLYEYSYDESRRPPGRRDMYVSLAAVYLFLRAVRNQRRCFEAQEEEEFPLISLVAAA